MARTLLNHSQTWLHCSFRHLRMGPTSHDATMNVCRPYHDFEDALKFIRSFRDLGTDSMVWNWSSMEYYLPNQESSPSSSCSSSSSSCGSEKRTKFHVIWRMWISPPSSRTNIEAFVQNTVDSLLPIIGKILAMALLNCLLTLSEYTLPALTNNVVSAPTKKTSIWFNPWDKSRELQKNNVLRSWKCVWQCSKTSHLGDPQTLCMEPIRSLNEGIMGRNRHQSD